MEAVGGVGDEAGAGFEAVAPDRLLPGEEGEGGAVVDGRCVTGGDAAILAEDRP